MINDFNQTKLLGVINLTPNSFSDGKKFLDREFLKSQIQENKNRSGLVFDFGFESTAPKNSPITQEEEIRRFEDFFECLKGIDLSGCWISFDTYRPESFDYFVKRFSSRYKNQGYIFNDVSGVVDQDLFNLIKKYGKDDNFKFVFTSTNLEFRGDISSHSKCFPDGDIFESTVSGFRAALKVFRFLNVEDKVIFDPGLGFSKNYHQNWELIDRLDELMGKFPDTPWVIGFSKKSFLRKKVEASSDPHAVESLHKELIQKFSKTNRKPIFRVHDFHIL